MSNQHFSYWEGAEKQIKTETVRHNEKIKNIAEGGSILHRFNIYALIHLSQVIKKGQLYITLTTDYYGNPQIIFSLDKGITFSRFMYLFSGIEDVGFSIFDISKHNSEITIQLVDEINKNDVDVQVYISNVCERKKVGEEIISKYEYIC